LKRKSFLIKWILFITIIIVIPLTFKYLFFLSLEPFLQTGFLVMLSVSLALLMGLAGQISLGHAGFFGIGAYTSAILSIKYNMPVLLTIPLGAMMGMIAGFLVGYPVLRLKTHYLSLATLGVGIALKEFFKSAEITGGEIGLYNLPDITIGNLKLSSSLSHYYIVWGFAIVIIFLGDRLFNSSTGKRLLAIHSDAQSAEAIGINVFQNKIYIFVLSSGIAAFTGALFAHCSCGAIVPEEFGVMLSIKIIIMVVIGGMYSVYGAAIGAAIISLLPEIIRRIGSFTGVDLARLTYIQDIIFGIILIIFIIYTPRGIISRKEE